MKSVLILGRNLTQGTDRPCPGPLVGVGGGWHRPLPNLETLLGPRVSILNEVGGVVKARYNSRWLLQAMGLPYHRALDSRELPRMCDPRRAEPRYALRWCWPECCAEHRGILRTPVGGRCAGGAGQQARPWPETGAKPRVLRPPCLPRKVSHTQV